MILPGEVLIKVRQNLRLSQSGMARRIGKAQCTISRLESGRQAFSDRLMRLFKSCLSDADYLELLEAVIEKRKRSY